MKAIITGGAGFIGSAIAEHLLANGFSVTIIDNLTRNSIQYNQSLLHNSRLTFNQVDICDQAALMALDNDFTHIFHLAAIAGVSKYFSAPADVMRINTLGTFNMLEVAKKQHSLRLFVDFSTSEIYGSFCHNVSEDGDIKMECLSEKRWTYASSKIASERFVMSYYWQYDVPVSIVRPFNIYGPGQTGEGVISNFIINSLHNKPIVVTGNGEQLRSFCFIDDMVRGLSLILDQILEDSDKVIGEAYNIGNDADIITMNSLAKLVRHLTHSSSEIVHRRHLGADVIVRSPNISKLRKLTYHPQVSLEEGIARSVAWYQENILETL